MRRAIRASTSALVLVAVLSGLVNLLMLTSSIYMMQVYDRVLGSRSVPTLVAISLLAALAYLVQWVFDALRQRLTALVGERIEVETIPALQRASVDLTLRGTRSPLETLHLFRDLDSLRAFVGGPGMLTLFDLPWIPIYVVVSFALHPWLGWMTIGGAVLLALLTVLTELMARGPTATAQTSASIRNQIAESVQRGAEVMRALGMERAIWRRWEAAETEYLTAQRRSSGVIGILSGLSRMLRFILQSSVLGLGAYLVINGQLSGGAIIAASILSGRALAPIDQAIANWRPFVLARQSYARLKAALPQFETTVERMDLPPPVQSFRMAGVDVAVPGTTRLVARGITFQLSAGDGLGIIGPSASGKSSLARVMVGVWPPGRGRVLLDGASIDNYDPERLGPHIGFMPQDVQLFDGTIAQNIARFSEKADSEAVIAAAKAASFHEFVLAFPQGYDTRIGPAGAHLSSGQRQRLGLARALFGNPFLVVLDEPNANLDAEGEAAVSAALKGVRDRGGIAVVIAHRPSAVAQVNLLMVLQNGEVAAFGPRDDILGKMVRNASRLGLNPQAKPPGGPAT